MKFPETAVRGRRLPLPCGSSFCPITDIQFSSQSIEKRAHPPFLCAFRPPLTELPAHPPNPQLPFTAVGPVQCIPGADKGFRPDSGARTKWRELVHIKESRVVRIREYQCLLCWGHGCTTSLQAGQLYCPLLSCAGAKCFLLPSSRYRYTSWRQLETRRVGLMQGRCMPLRKNKLYIWQHFDCIPV